MTLTLSDLDDLDRHHVAGLASIAGRLRHDATITLPSGVELSAAEVVELNCQHRRLREVLENVFECVDCEHTERA